MFYKETELVLGTMKAAGTFNGLVLYPRNQASVTKFLRSALSAGFTTLDTAPIYGRGAAEMSIGRFLPRSEMRIWTKVGVDIRPTLPQLDYSFKGMCASLEGSLERLRLDSVQTVFIHNPDVHVLKEPDIVHFAHWCLNTGKAEHVGVSLLEPTHLWELPSRSVISHVMCEASTLEHRLELAHAIKESYVLVLRSPLEGGRLLDSPTRKGLNTRQFIAKRISQLCKELHPSAMVVGPRLERHLPPYAQFTSLLEPVHTDDTRLSTGTIESIQ